jgi:RNA methyltransferase, TrmH family
MQLKKYTHDAPYSYAFGVFPTLELLHHQVRHVEQVLLSSAGERNEGVGKIRALCEVNRIPVEVNNRLVERLSPKDNTYAIGVFRKYRQPLSANNNHIVLVNPGDMGNLGTTLRTLAGFAITDLALVRPAVDIFDPRAIRASMGAAFQVNFAYYDSFGDYCAAFKHHHLYLFMTDGDTRLDAARFVEPFALVFGSESSGLPNDIRSQGSTITIPHRPTIDSLNLSVAIGIAVYAAVSSKNT